MSTPSMYKLMIEERDALTTERVPHAERAEKIDRIRTAALNPANRTQGSEPDSRTQAVRERDEWERAAADYAKTIGTQYESVKRIEARVAEQIATWLDRRAATASRDYLFNVAHDIRAHAWKPATSGEGESK